MTTPPTTTYATVHCGDDQAEAKHAAVWPSGSNPDTHRAGDRDQRPYGKVCSHECRGDTHRSRPHARVAQPSGGPLAERGGDPRRVVDLDRLDANLRDLQSYADAHGIALWPHTKTHKSPEIGLRQLELGAGGLTVAKTGEAEVFQEAGAPKILVHYPPFGTDKWERLGALPAMSS